MTVENFAKEFGYEVLCLPDPNRNVDGGYAGDLLSWVMGRLGEGSAWITIMSNVNIVAVAALTDPCCIILSEGVAPDDGVIERAASQGVNLLRSQKDTFSVAADVRSVL